MKRAILSVWDKTGLVELGQGLVEAGYELVSTGGTARALQEAGLPVTMVEDVTGFPEILDGRVKTLHPAVHGGILARREPAHLAELEQHGISPVDLVVCNLYPFQATIAKPNVSLEEAIEQIDIGGVTLLRAAAKNHHAVAVVVSPQDYGPVLAELRDQGQVSLATRQRLAAEAFRHTADYDVAIAGYLHAALERPASPFPPMLQISLPRFQELKYGENPHQGAAIYGDGALGGRVVLGDALSYNNLLDMDAAWRVAYDFDAPTIAIIKHGTPTGVASHDNLATAYERAYATDTVSPFGCVIGCNRVVTESLVATWGRLMVHGIVAPGYAPEALALMAKRSLLRAVEVPADALPDLPWEVRSVRAGLLLQQRDQLVADESQWQVVTQRAPTAEEWEGLRFNWKVVKHVKSNAIVFGKGRATTGIGAGQMSRVDSVQLAVIKAGENARGSVMASDAYFPFPDGIEEAAQAGIIAVIQPGGSVRDDDAIAIANTLGLAMVFTGHRHFRH